MQIYGAPSAALDSALNYVMEIFIRSLRIVNKSFFDCVIKIIDAGERELISKDSYALFINSSLIEFYCK
jgi:hypothetical protein